jgi:hypothetical protein
MSAHQPQLFDVTASDPSPKIKTIEPILECLNSIRYINHGGCGIAALAIYRWSKANGHFVPEHAFRFLWDYDEAEERDRNDERLFNGELSDVATPSHIVIELYDGLYDSDGLYDPDAAGDLEQEYHLNADELLAVINAGNWNSLFNRARYIPVIEFALGIDLSDVNTD